MPQAHQFEYLPLVLRDRGPARFPRPGFMEAPQTQLNRANRGAHGHGLQAAVTTVATTWRARQEQRDEQGLPETGAGIPLLLKIDPTLDIDALRATFEFEIISEEEDGFVIVASEDISLSFFQRKLND